MTSSALRPLSLGELLDRTFALYRAHFLVFVGIVALPNLLTLAIQTAMLPMMIGNPQDPAVAFERLGEIMAVGLAAVVVAAIAQAATVVAVSRVHLEQPISIASAFRSLRGVAFKAVLVTLTIFFIIVLVAGVVVFGASIAAAIGLAASGGAGARSSALVMMAAVFVIAGLIGGIPTIYLALRWALSVPAAVIERADLGPALRRSSELTAGQRGRIFMIYALYFVLTIVLGGGFQALALVVSGLHSPTAVSQNLTAQLIVYVGNFLTQCLIGPLGTIALALSYYDARVRKEAFDIEYMMGEIDRAPSPTAS